MADRTQLRAALTDIDGVGDATAEKILDVLDEEIAISDSVREMIETAHDEHKHGDPEYAGKFVRRAYNELHDE